MTTAHDSALVPATADARMALREAASAAAEAAARAHSIADLLDETLAVLADGEVTSLPAAPSVEARWRRTAALSPREREVLALVAEGRTNKAIAEVLFLSPNTVKTHVTSLLHKLQADTRVQLAAIAARQGLRQWS
jgi:DNA-binding CsgD family transcriptional regulator